MSALPIQRWRALARTELRPETPKGLDALWHRGMGLVRRTLMTPSMFASRAERVLQLESEMASLPSRQFAEETVSLRVRFRASREEPHDVVRALAVIREAAWRETGMRPFPVQIAGALALNAGCIAEMATGEGKTLTATLPAIIAGWRGRGCHIVTVNDYLARRDAEWMNPVYRACGVTVAWITGDSTPAQRRAAYSADVTYATNKEVAADFLRDRLLLGGVRSLAGALASEASRGSRFDHLVQRGLECAVVDEADSVLLDEAVTPLIISGDSPNPIQKRAMIEAMQIASELAAASDYTVDVRRNEISLTPSGLERACALSKHLGGVWSGRRRTEELVVQALTARLLFHEGKHYLVRDKSVVIIDEQTGRAMPDRTWRDGLHQAIEAKESLDINAPKETLARISFQRFFRLYRSLSGMTGTASEEAGELWRTYRLPVVVIPPNRPSRREQRPDRVFASAADKWAALTDEIERLHAVGRPVLIGARTVEQSERLSQLLSQRRLPHEVLSALRHEREAAIIEHAGETGRITIATNMAGRGTDIRLGAGVAEKGGLHVIAAERHESPRIDRQLFGRAGRQGDPGSAQAFISMEDELFQRHAPHAARWLRQRLVTNPVNPAIARAITRRAQADAQRLARNSRRAVLRSDDWLDDALGYAAAPL
ncbi:MAG: prepilin peptidase [Phycisphaerae bacterium]|nr:prepilin peptidase [Phycisphaerae bacterium]